MTQSGIDLAAYNSVENAADIVAVADALGYEDIDLYGGSYGSLLAQHVMRDYPDRVRSVVLDAVSPLRHAPNMLNKAHSADRSLRLLFEQCQADSACNEAVPDLEQVSEMRLTLEGLSARLAAERATEDDIVVLEALRLEQARISAEDSASASSRRLFDVDPKFHQAIARAAHNQYLADGLERLFGLSQRLWYLALPQLGFLPTAVETHLDLVDAIKNKEAGRAETIMRSHVQEFYDQVRKVLAEEL